MPHPNFASCIAACYECATACNHCAASCLQEPDVRAMARCIVLDIDCQATCLLAAAAMGRGSENHAVICRACAEVCRRCGEECGKHDMDHCRQCAAACLRCAQECERMAA